GSWGLKSLISNLCSHPCADRGPVQQFLDAAPLRRPNPVVRDRGHVADRGDREAHRLESAERAFAARARTLDLDLERSDAVVGGLLAGVLCGDLRGVWRRLPAALEAHHSGARP